MKKILRTFTTIVLLLINLPSFTVFAYTDVPTQYKYAEAITFLTEKGIISGYSDNSFKPDNTLNRAELLKILIETAYSEADFNAYSNQSCFKDVPENIWFTKYVCFAQNQGIIKGYGDNTFKPAKKISLTEALKISLEVFHYQYTQTLGPWYKGVIDKASENNFIPTDFYSFTQSVKRGQIADIITRIIKSQEGELDTYLGAKIDQIITYEFLENAELDPLDDIGQSELPKEHILTVPFSAQAPYGQWTVPYDEACEEASLIMIDYYLENNELNKESAKSEILSMVEWEEQERGYGVDIGTYEIADIAENYYGKKSKIYQDEEVTIENIKRLLFLGYPIVVPVAGQYLGNPNFTGAGPPYHVVVITGYNEEVFFSNDPGTSRGENYIYPTQTLFDAIHDWTGNKSTILEGKKAIIILE